MKNFKDELLRFEKLIKQQTPFALARYGDGELAVIERRRYKGVNDEFQFSPVLYPQFSHRVQASLSYKAKDYYVGLSIPDQIKKGHYTMKQLSGQDDEHLTFSNLFHFSNYAHYRDKILPLFKRYSKIVLVCNKNANPKKLPFSVDQVFPVSKNAFREYEELEKKLKKLAASNKGWLFLFACGPLANVLVHSLHQTNSRNTYLDIGSTLNGFMDPIHKRQFFVDGTTGSKIVPLWPRKEQKLILPTKKFLVIGHPRCGTGYSSSLLNAYGFDVGHEKMGRDGISSWFFAVNNDTLWSNKMARDYYFEHVIMCIRDPFNAIPSQIYTNTPGVGKYWGNHRMVKEAKEYMDKYIKIPKTIDFFNQAAYTYINWYKLIKKSWYNYLVFPIEQKSKLKAFLLEKGIKIEKGNPLPSNKVNHRQHRELNYRQWKQIKPNYIMQLDKMCRTHGYQLLSNRISKLK